MKVEMDVAGALSPKQIKFGGDPKTGRRRRRPYQKERALPKRE